MLYKGINESVDQSEDPRSDYTEGEEAVLTVDSLIEFHGRMERTSPMCYYLSYRGSCVIISARHL